MTLRIGATRVPAENDGDDELIGLMPGDGIMATATHEISVDGEKSWIKFGATTTVQESETTQEAYLRLEKVVDQGSLKKVEASVKAVRAFTAQR